MFEQLRFLTFGWRDAIEIIVVAYGVYRLLLLLQGTRAVQMLIGIVVLVFTYELAWVFKFTMFTYLLGIVFTYGAFAALVIFQPELRAALAHLGQSRVTRFFRRMEVSEVAEDGRLARGITAVQLRDIIAGGKPRATAEHPLLEIPG
jgi:diadenylate cyclase